MMFRRGQVLVEFAMAAVGLVAIAFVTARVTQWMNQSMVDRNDHFQGTRLQAGQGPGLVRFDGPNGPIHLLGPTAASTAVQPSPGGGQSAAPPGCPGGAEKFVQAANLRSQAFAQLTSGNTELSGDITRLQNEAKWLVVLANKAQANANTVSNIISSIQTIDARLNQINGDPQVQAIGGINWLDEYLHTVAVQISNLNNQIASIDSQILALNQQISSINQQLTQIADRENQILTVLIPACTNVFCILTLLREYSALETQKSALINQRDNVLLPQLSQLAAQRQPLADQLSTLQAQQSYLLPLLQERDTKRGTTAGGGTVSGAGKWALLNQVDGIISWWQGTLPSPNLGWDFWNHIPSLSPMAPIDLSDRYDQLLWQYNHPDPSLGEPDLLGFLRQIRDRLTQLAWQLAAEALNRYNQANALINNDQVPRSQAVQWLIEAAENLEREARTICSSLPN